MNNEIVVQVDAELKSLIPKFVASQKAQLEQIKVALQRLNYLDLKILGHKIKGACGGYGFSDLGDFGVELEKGADAQDVQLLSKTVSELETYLSKMKIEYRKE